MRPQDDQTGYVYSDIPWRYSGLSARFLGLDPLAVLLIPFTIFGLRQGWGWPFIGVVLLLVALFAYVSFKGYPSLRVFLQSLAVRLIGRGRWKTR
jgi:hypothetical protein